MAQADDAESAMRRRLARGRRALLVASGGLAAVVALLGLLVAASTRPRLTDEGHLGMRELTPPQGDAPATASRESPAQVAPPGMVLMSPWRARLPKITAITLAVITALVLLKGVLTPAAPKPVVSASSTPGPPGPGIGHLAPEVTLLDLSGKPVALSSLRGKVVVLNFWYVACEPCQYEMPALEKTYLAQQANGFEIVGVDTADSAADISAFASRLGVTYPILRDTNLGAVDAYGVYATPTSYVIDRRGVIRDRILGPVKQSALDKEVASLVKESAG